MSEWFANKPGEVGGKHEKKKEKKKNTSKSAKNGGGFNQASLA